MIDNTFLRAAINLGGMSSCVGETYSGIKWIEDSPAFTEEELNTEIARIKTEYTSQEYSRNREAEYPSIGDQLDMIYHNGDGGATFQAAIKAVKDKYPKP
jgi:hypothetical protein